MLVIRSQSAPGHGRPPTAPRRLAAAVHTAAPAPPVASAAAELDRIRAEAAAAERAVVLAETAAVHRILAAHTPPAVTGVSQEEAAAAARILATHRAAGSRTAPNGAPRPAHHREPAR